MRAQRNAAFARELCHACDIALENIEIDDKSGRRQLVAAAGPESLAGIRVASIGPVTSATARRLGVEITAEASRFDENGLIEAILSKGIIEP